MHYLQRKYIDLILQASSKWVNWDPPIPVEVGTYGGIESETGALSIDGNIYDPEFQKELDRLGVPLRMADHLPQEGDAEKEMIIASGGAKQVEAHLSPEVGVAGIASASLKGQWQFERGKRNAILAIHTPRVRFLPQGVVLGKLHKVSLLKDKWLVTVVYKCPAYSMYLSNKAGQKVSLSLSGDVPIAGVAGATAGGAGGFSFSHNVQADLFREASNPKGEHVYTPLYQLKRQAPWYQRILRDGEVESPPTGDDTWDDAPTPWDQLNEDGEEDKLEVQEIEESTDSDDF